ncbi:hypothetical protein C1645_802901 [Glomus cerebriforme]|uniref:Uncharacterized protein n=1 Tax=Glomus cerebriforme TaxID=658196 RepID=A0A397TCK2_9GLOM|nr:hypothetical protein C1645_802901 [Glomus cerebriforme]
MDHPQNNLGDDVYSYNNEFFTMNDIFPAHLNIPPNYNYQQPIFSNNNDTNSPDHNYQSNDDVSNDSDAISSDNNYQQYDALNNIGLNNSQQFTSNDSSNDDTIFSDHYNQQYNDSNNISFYDSQQFMPNGTSNCVADQQYIPPHNYQQFDDTQFYMQYVDQNQPQPNSINIIINSSQVSEIFRSGFKIIFMPITNSDMVHSTLTNNS